MRFGIYNTDGECVRGELGEYTDLAKDLDASTVALYLSTRGSRVILGTSVNLHIGRSDTLLFIAEEESGSFSGNTIRSFFKTAISELEGEGYTIENIAKDNELFDRLREEPFSDFNNFEQQVNPVELIAGKILINVPAFVVSRNTFQSISLIARIAEGIKGALSLSPGFTFVCSRMTFSDADLSILPGKPSKIEVEDVNLDSASMANSQDTTKFLRVYSVYRQIGNDIVNLVHSRKELAEQMIRVIVHSISARNERKDWKKFALKHGISVKTAADEAIQETIAGDESVLAEYMHQEHLQQQDANGNELIKELNKFKEEDRERFFERGAQVLKKTTVGATVFKQYSRNYATNGFNALLNSRNNEVITRYITSKSFDAEVFRGCIGKIKKFNNSHTHLSQVFSSIKPALRRNKEALKIMREEFPLSAENAIRNCLKGDNFDLEELLGENFQPGEFKKALDALPMQDLRQFNANANLVLADNKEAQKIAIGVEKKKKNQLVAKRHISQSKPLIIRTGVILLAGLIIAVALFSLWSMFAPSEQLRIVVSDTEYPVVDQAVQKFIETHSKVNVEQKHLENLEDCNAFVNPDTVCIFFKNNDDEDNSASLQQTAIAKGGIAIVVHRDNHVEDLSIENLRDIFSGEITNWNELKGDNQTITFLSSNSDSVETVLFQKLVMKDTAIQENNGTSEITTGSIGYVSTSSLDGTVKSIQIGDGGQTYGPEDDRYPLAGSLIMVTRDEPAGLSKDLVAFLKTGGGEAILEDNGFSIIEQEPEASLLDWRPL